MAIFVYVKIRSLYDLCFAFIFISGVSLIDQTLHRVATKEKKEISRTTKSKMA